MGVRLMVEVLDHMPESASLAERLLLIALAEKASDATRRVIWSTGDDPRVVLRRRLGVSESGLTKVFRRLRANDIDPRIAFGTDKHGRPVFAHEGRAAEYEIPILRACPDVQALDGESLHGQAPSEGREPAPTSACGHPTGHPPEPESLPREAPLVPPSLEVPSPRARGGGLIPPTHRAAVESLVAAHGKAITEADAVDCVAQVAPRVKGDLASYVSGFPTSDVISNAERWRRKQPVAPRVPAGRRCAEHRRPFAGPERECEHGCVDPEATALEERVS